MRAKCLVFSMSSFLLICFTNKHNVLCTNMEEHFKIKLQFVNSSSENFRAGLGNIFCKGSDYKLSCALLAAEFALLNSAAVRKQPWPVLKQHEYIP